MQRDEGEKRKLEADKRGLRLCLGVRGLEAKMNQMGKSLSIIEEV